MARIEIDFSWPVDVDGYDLVRRQEIRSAARLLLGDTNAEMIDVTYLQRRGGRLAMKQPLQVAGLFDEFARLGNNPLAHQAFANKWGLLGVDQFESDGAVDEEKTSRWSDLAEGMAGAIADWRAGGDPSWSAPLQNRTLARLSVKLRARADSARPEMVFVPWSLYAAMSLQFMQTVASGSDLVACKNCGTWFERGPGGKRSHALFCSAVCRAKHHKSSQQEARQ